MTSFLSGAWFFKEKRSASHSLETPPAQPAVSSAQIAMQRLRADLAKSRCRD